VKTTGQCGEATLTVTGKFSTNGAGGMVSYHWVRNGTAQPQQSVSVAKGDTSTKVITDTWTPQNAGTEQLVFTGPSYPTQTQSYSCGG
jgi:hypothetical protein